MSAQNEIKNFRYKFILINSISFFPILLALILGVNIYDNLRLFLFILPLLSIVAALSLTQLIDNFNNSFKIKVSLIFLIIIFSMSFYRFILLTPYQYTYVNFSYPNLNESVDKFEQDYWGTTYKELVENLGKKYSKEEIQKFKIADCFGGDSTLLYYLNKKFGVKKLYNIDKRPLEATHIVLTNRSFLNVINNPSVKGLVNKKGQMLLKDMEKVVRSENVKTTCFNEYAGTDEVIVSRGGTPLSILRRLNK